MFVAASEFPLAAIFLALGYPLIETSIDIGPAPVYSLTAICVVPHFVLALKRCLTIPLGARKETAMSLEDRLSQLLHFRPHPGPTPDPRHCCSFSWTWIRRCASKLSEPTCR